MNQLIINRCTKPPGLIQRALTYYLELNEKGLYLICLGKATSQPLTRDPLSQVIANEAVKFFDNRYEKEIQKNESLLKEKGMEEMSKTKNSFYLTTDKITKFTTTILHDKSISIKLKGEVNRTFVCHPGFGRICMMMQEEINKK